MICTLLPSTGSTGPSASHRYRDSETIYKLAAGSFARCWSGWSGSA